VLAGALVATAASCTGGTGAPSGSVATTPSPDGSGTIHDPPSPATLAIRPAPYSLIAPIQRTTAVWDGHLVYIAGGLDASGTTVGGVFSLDPTSGRLAAVGSLAQPVHDGAATLIGGRIFVFGGGAGSGTDTVQSFDPRSGRAAVVGHLPVALSDLEAARIGGTTYLVGGFDGSRPRREIYATTDGHSFSIAGRLQVGLRYPAVAVADGRLVIAGGLSASGPVDDVSSFDPASGSVTPIGHLPAPIAHAAALTLGSDVYVVGGRNASDHAQEGVSIVDPASGQVHAATALHGPVADAAVAAGPRDALLIGGWGATTLSQVLTASLTTHASAKPTSAADPPSHDVYAAIDTTRLAPTVANDPRYVYVPNGRPGTLEVIDPTTFRIVRTIDFGPGSYPEHVTPSWDMRRLYVDVDGHSELGVIDPGTGKLVRVIHGVDHPYNLYFTVDGSKAIDVAEYFDRLNFMNPRTWRLIRSVPMPCNGPDHLDFSADGSYLLIGCEFDGTVVKVDVRRMKVLGTMNVGGLPVDVKLSPDGRVFYVANQGLGGVSVVDPNAMKVLAFIPTGGGAHGMAISRDTTKLYVTNRLAGTISTIDFSTRKVVATWNVGGSPDMIQVTPNGKQLWVSNRYGTTVEVVSTKTGRVIRQIQVGADPHGLSFFPQPGRFSLGHNGVYR
jgi:YVTN family beta-propeller protein